MDEDKLRHGPAIDFEHGVYCVVCDIYGLKWWWAHRDFVRPMFELLATRLAARQAAERDDYLTAAKLAEQVSNDVSHKDLVS